MYMNANLKKALDIVYDKMKGFVVKAVFENDVKYVFAIRCLNGSVPIIGSIPAVMKKDLKWKPYSMYDDVGDLKLVCEMK